MAKIVLLLMLAAIVIATQVDDEASWNEYELAELNARRISEGARYAQVDASGSGWSATTASGSEDTWEENTRPAQGPVYFLESVCVR